MFDEKTENILKELEKTQQNYWNIDRSCAQFLNLLIKIKKAKNVLEIGTSNGYSGIWILKALEETKGKFTTIEYWEKRQSVARGHFREVSNIKFDARIGSAIVVLEDLLFEVKDKQKEKFDFVFIDASKKEYLDYFKLIDEMIEDDGIILADNILSHSQKVKPYVEELMQNKNYESTILDIGAGMMLSLHK